MTGNIPWYRFKRRNDGRARVAMFTWWTLVPWFLITIARLIYGFRIHHRKRCPSEGPVLAICNHLTMLDPVLTGLALHLRGFRPLARKTLQEDMPRWASWMLNRYDPIYLDIDNPAPSSMKAVLAEMIDSRVAMVFPEGRRSEDGLIGPLQRGIWMLIRRGRAPVLPMAVEGVLDVMPPGGGLRRRGRLGVILGEPIPAEVLIEMGRDAALEHLRLVMDDLRMELRADIRSRSRGRWPRPGPADQSLRESLADAASSEGH